MTSLIYLSKAILALSVRAKGCHFNRTHRIQSGGWRVLGFKLAVVSVFSCGEANEGTYSVRTRVERDRRHEEIVRASARRGLKKMMSSSGGKRKAAVNPCTHLARHGRRQTWGREHRA